MSNENIEKNPRPKKLDIETVEINELEYDCYEKYQFALNIKRSEYFSKIITNYYGRFNYSGPAVTAKNTKERQNIIRVTEQELQRDHMAKGYVFYPKLGDNPDIVKWLNELKAGVPMDKINEKLIQ